MKNLFAILCVCLLSLCSSNSFAQTPSPGKAQTKPVDAAKTQTKAAADQESDATVASEISNSVTEYYAAWNTLDPSKAARFYAKDQDLVFYDLLPLQYKGWKTYQDGVTALLKEFSSFRLNPNKDLQVTRRGRIAWTTLTFHLSAKQKSGTAMEVDGRHTAIWEKKKGKWLIVHEHVSAPLPQS